MVTSFSEKLFRLGLIEKEFTKKLENEIETMTKNDTELPKWNFVNPLFGTVTSNTSLLIWNLYYPSLFVQNFSVQNNFIFLYYNHVKKFWNRKVKKFGFKNREPRRSLSQTKKNREWKMNLSNLRGESRTFFTRKFSKGRTLQYCLLTSLATPTHWVWVYSY